MALTLDLTGRRAIVTGVSSGIGAGIAAKLAEAGCDVAGCALEAADAPGPRAFLDAVASAGRKGLYASADLADPAAASRWVADAAGRLGGVDVVVGCAGRNVFRGAAGCTDAEWAECMELDLASQWRVARAAHPYLIESPHAVVLLVTSNHADRTIAGCFPYNVAKAGANALVRSLAIEWGPKVRAVAVAPGFIDTPGNDAWFGTFADPAAERRRTELSHPVNRLGTPAQIGALCVFLASRHAAFISGTVVTVDGGRGAMLQDAPA